MNFMMPHVNNMTTLEKRVIHVHMHVISEVRLHVGSELYARTNRCSDISAFSQMVVTRRMSSTRSRVTESRIVFFHWVTIAGRSLKPPALASMTFKGGDVTNFDADFLSSVTQI
jgi:hypothetical protein